MNREEHGLIERRIRELEEEVRKMKEPLERTLMDVRQLISSLENPFNYITRIIDLDRFAERRAAHDAGHVRRVEEANETPVQVKKREKAGKEETRPWTESAQRGESNLLNILACASILIKLLGQEYTVKFLNSRIVGQLAPREVIDGLIDAVEFLSKYSGVELFVQSTGQPSIDTIVSAAYIVKLLANSSVDDRFFILLMFGLRESLLRFKNRGEGV